MGQTEALFCSLQTPYVNITACQTLGNMCVAIMYTEANQGDDDLNDACAAYLSLAKREDDNADPRDL